jgi:hypothetical protein
MSCLVKYSVNVFFIIWRIFVPVNLRPLNRVRLSDFDSNTNNNFVYKYIVMQIYIKYKTKTTKHLIVYTTMTSKVYAYLNKRLTPIILR